MKHFVLSAVLLLTVTAFSWWSVCRVEAVTDRTAALVVQAQAKGYGDADEALSAAGEFWEANSGFLCTVLRHDQVDAVAQALARLEASTEHDDFYSTCAELLLTLEHIAQTELPLLRNIL